MVMKGRKTLVGAMVVSLLFLCISVYAQVSRPYRNGSVWSIALIKVKPGMEKEFEAVAKELVAKVNANEPGCKLYALHHGEAPHTYVFMERYADQAAVDAHRATDHFKTLGRKMGEFMDGRAEVLRLREVE